MTDVFRDVFRKEYKQLNDSQKADINHIKNQAEQLYEIFADTKGDARMLSLAVTKLEESVMWAIKSIT